MHELFLKIHLILINLKKRNDSKTASLPQHKESETSEGFALLDSECL